jgi:homoserine O-acetyltransferase
LRIIDAWQWFDLVREGRAENFEKLFARCSDHEFLVFTIDSDLAFYPREQEKLVKVLKAMKGQEKADEVTWITVHSDKGHDSFLLEPKLYTPHLRALLLGE